MSGTPQKVNQRIGQLQRLIEKEGVVQASRSKQLNAADKSLLLLIVGLQTNEGSRQAVENLSSGLVRSKYTVEPDTPTKGMKTKPREVDEKGSRKGQHA